MPNDELKPNKVERPDCHHMQVIMARPSLNLSDYSQRLVPELREKLATTKCEQCEQEKAELAKQKLVQEMREKSHKA